MFNEYRTYSANRDKEIDWQSVDDRKIFDFITELYALPSNNAIMPFDTSHDITAMLREQWAGLFQRLLMEASNQTSYALMKELKVALDTSRKLADVLASERREGDSIVQDILLTSHPIFGAIRNKMNIPYRVFFTSKAELDSWLGARTFTVDDDFSLDDDYFQWENRTLNRGKNIGLLQVSKMLFDEAGNLNVLSGGKWNEDWVKYSVSPKKTVSPFDDDDVPF